MVEEVFKCLSYKMRKCKDQANYPIFSDIPPINLPQSAESFHNFSEQFEGGFHRIMYLPAKLCHLKSISEQLNKHSDLCSVIIVKLVTIR